MSIQYKESLGYSSRYILLYFALLFLAYDRSFATAPAASAMAWCLVACVGGRPEVSQEAM